VPLPDLLHLLAHAPDPGGDGQRPTNAAMWLTLGSRLGLEGLVPALVDADLLTAPPSIRAEADTLRAAADMEQSWIGACTWEALAALKDAGLAAAPLKGPLLAARLYPPPLVRRSTDIDLLVTPHDLPPALAVLAKLDYRPTDAHLTAHHIKHHHHVILHRPASPPLELHWAPLHALGTRVHAADVLQHPAGLDPHAELVYLAAHAASHDFERQLWLYDLAAYVRAHPEMQLARLDALAKSWRLARAWRLAQQQVVALLGPDALPWPVPKLRPHDALVAKGQRMYMKLPHKTPARFAVRVACLLGTCDNPWRAGWLAQFAALRAMGDLAEKRGLPVPGGWPPLPPFPPGR
jgi:hypothetical protein